MLWVFQKRSLAFLGTSSVNTLQILRSQRLFRLLRQWLYLLQEYHRLCEATWWPQVPVNFGEIGLVHWMKAFSSEEQSHGSLMTKPLVQLPVATALIRYMVATHSKVLVLALEGAG